MTFKQATIATLTAAFMAGSVVGAFAQAGGSSPPSSTGANPSSSGDAGNSGNANNPVPPKASPGNSADPGKPCPAGQTKC